MAATVAALTSAAFTVNGTATGLVTVGSTTGFVVGARCSLTDSGANKLDVVIIAIKSPTVMQVQAVAGSPSPFGTLPINSGTKTGANYGGSDVSAFLTVNTATIVQPTQKVFTGSWPAVTVNTN